MELKNLNKSLERAEKYLNIVRKIETREYTNKEFEYIQENAGILQKEDTELYI